MARISKLQKLLISLLVPVIVVLGAVQILATDQYLGFEYGKASFPVDPYGFERAQRLAFASTTLRWVREGQPIQALADQRLDDQPLYNQRELKHMQDVQDVFLTARRIWYLALGLLFLIGVFTQRSADRLMELAQGFKIGGLLVFGLVVVVGLLAVIGWQVWFVAFHQIFFTPGSWTFNTSDTLIRLFPERFWFDAALTISGLSLAGGLVIALIAHFVQQRLQSIPKIHLARALKPSKG